MRPRPALLAVLAILLVPAAAHAQLPSKAPTHRDTPATIPVDLAQQVRTARLAGMKAFTVSGSVQYLPTTWCGTERTTDDVADAAQLSDEPVYKIVYAYAADQPDRFSAWKDQLQADVSLIGEFMSQQAGATKSPRVDMGTSCGPRYADIQTVALPEARSSYVDDFDSITGAVSTALGSTPVKRNIVILADGLTTNTGGFYGLGEHYVGSIAEVAGSSNIHNSGGLYAALFPPLGYTPGSSFWPEGMLHEITHTLGAVNSGAPHATSQGHCTDGADVMCYADGGASALPYSTSSCPAIAGDAGMTQTYDCGRDDYFSTSPAPGSYLATHWNVYDNVFESPCATIGFACGADSTAPPAAVGAPRVTGTAKVTNALTADRGTWSGTPTSFAYQWQRNSGSGFADIGGASAATYTLVPADANAQVRVQVSATNANGSASNTSSASSISSFNPPVNSTPPSISGTAQRLSVLTATSGTWTGATSTSRKWQRLVGGVWTDIPSQTGSTYTLASADVGTSVRVLETATNADGPASAPSGAIGPVAGVTPALVTAPVINGTPQRTATLSASTGTWSADPSAFAYQWQRDSGSGFADIGGATGSSYVLGPADLGASVRVLVTASNVDGPSSPAAADAVGPVQDLEPPLNTTSPALLGTAQEGRLLTATNGDWDNGPTSYARRWQRAIGGVFSDILGATGPTYLLGSSDVGHPIRVVVVATNGAGDSQPAASSPTGEVAAGPVTVIGIEQPQTPTPPADVYRAATVSLKRGKRTVLKLLVTSRVTRSGIVAMVPSKRVKVTRRGTYRLTLCAGRICITKPFRARHGKAKLPTIVANGVIVGPVTLRLIGPGGLATGALPRASGALPRASGAL